MKQLFVILMLFVAFSINSTAQTVKTATTNKSVITSQAEKVAFANKDIIKRVDEKTGVVKYVRRDVCEKSGKVSFVAVQYNKETGTFVDLPKKSAKAKVKAKRKSSCSSRRSCNRPGKSCGSKKSSCSPKKTDKKS